MERREYLKALKPGDTVTRFFHGAGYVTQGEEATVVHVRGDLLWIGEELSESEYSRNSSYVYSVSTGNQIEHSFGMYHTIELPGSVAPDSDSDADDEE